MLDAQTLPQSYIRLSDWSKKFQPANSIELVATLSVPSFNRCAYGKNERFSSNSKLMTRYDLLLACNLNVRCRTFDYDSSSLVCRLFEGALNTGYTISAPSTSRVGSVQYFPDFLTAVNQSCAQCAENRYLTCSNSACQCPTHTFWNGSQCVNQRYENASCLNNKWCRNDPFGLVCSVSNICTSKTY